MQKVSDGNAVAVCRQAIGSYTRKRLPQVQPAAGVPASVQPNALCLVGH
jgi:hypothetical protein